MKRTRSYAKLLNSIWSSHFVELTPEAQRLYMLLISQPETNAAGIVPLMERRWARMAQGTTLADITKALDELEAGRYVYRDEDTEELFIRSFIANDEGYRTPNILTNIREAIAQIHSPKLRAMASRTLAVVLGETPGDDTDQGLDEPLTEGFDQGLHEPIKEPMGHQSPTPHHTNTTPLEPERGETEPPTVPPRLHEPADAGKREPDPLYEAMVEACEMCYGEMTDRERRACGVAVAEIRRRGATAEEVASRADVFRRKYASQTLTPNALAKRWGSCAPRRMRAVSVDDPTSRMSQQAVARW